MRTVRISNSFTHQFWHKELTGREHTYDLKFRRVPDPEYGAPGALTKESRAFHESTLFVALWRRSLATCLTESGATEDSASSNVRETLLLDSSWKCGVMFWQ